MMSVLYFYLFISFCRGTALSFIQRRSIMKVNGMLIKGVAGAECITVMARFMRASGMMIRGMARECSD